MMGLAMFVWHRRTKRDGAQRALLADAIHSYRRLIFSRTMVAIKQRIHENRVLDRGAEGYKRLIFARTLAQLRQRCAENMLAKTSAEFQQSLAWAAWYEAAMRCYRRNAVTALSHELRRTYLLGRGFGTWRGSARQHRASAVQDRVASKLCQQIHFRRWERSWRRPDT